MYAQRRHCIVSHSIYYGHLRACRSVLGLRSVNLVTVSVGDGVFSVTHSLATENCAPSTNSQGFSIVDSIRQVAFEYGTLQVFRAYLQIESSLKMQNLRSELQYSGVSLVDCPHNGRKDVADKMMIGDRLL